MTTFALQMAASTGKLGPALKRAREAAHLTQVTAAERINVALRTLQNWEHGSARPRWASIERAAAVYGVEIEDFLHGDRDEPRAPSIGDRLEAIEAAHTRIEQKLNAVLDLFTDAEALAAAIDRRKAPATGEQSGQAGPWKVETSRSGKRSKSSNPATGGRRATS